MKHWLVILILAMVTPAFAQRSGHLPLGLRYALEQHSSAEEVHLYVKGDEVAIRNFVVRNGGVWKGKIQDYVSVMLSPSSVLALDTLDGVEYVHFDGSEGMPLLSQSRIQTNVNRVHNGDSDLPQPYFGEGVIVGVIDAGIELQHPDFQNADGSTRILELWDQTMGFDLNRTPSYGYGQVWDSADINDSICPHQDQTTWFGHGTNTAGIAVGNGASNAQYTGMAPQSDIIVVSSNFSALGWTATVADAINYIFSRAEAYGKPCVINTSIGTYLGSHDATDLAAVSIEGDIGASAGRIVVAAAGNSGAGEPYHLGYEATSDTNFTWFEIPSNVIPGQGNVYYELFGNVGDMERLQFSIGADKVDGSYEHRGSVAFDSILNRLNITYTENLMSASGNYLGEVNTWADSLNGTYRLQVWIQEIDSVDYNYRLSITGSGRFDLWSAKWLGYTDMVSDNLPTTTQFPEIGNYRSPDIQQSIVSSWTCSDKVVTVGNYYNRTTYVDVDDETVTLSGITKGAIAGSSSYGPTRKGIIKPEVAAPGDNTLTAGALWQLNNLLNTPSQRNRVAQGGMHHRAGGTSSASPVVAGIAALYLEHCSGGSWSTFEQALKASAFADQHTGNLPNFQWGYGKVDALELLRIVSPKPELVYKNHEFCAGDSLSVSVKNATSNMVWSNGSTAASIKVTQSGVYTLTATNGIGCRGVSDTLTAFRRPLPNVPTIIVEGAQPACHGDEVLLRINESFGAYTWSDGSQGASVVATTDGTWDCTVANVYGCTRTSLPVDIEFYPPVDDPVIAVNANGSLVLMLDTGTTAASIAWYKNGSLQEDSSQVVANPAIGVWQASIIDDDGCQHWSDEISVYALGADAKEGKAPSIFPNPTSSSIQLEHIGAFAELQLWSADGRVVTHRNLNGIQRLSIDMRPFSTGIYFVRLTSVQDVLVLPVIKE